MPTVIESTFVGDFKLGDNVVFNLSIMKTLRAYREAANGAPRRYLQKPLIVLNVSIIEALLYDFHVRAKWFTSEGVAGLPDKVLNYIRNKQIDKLESLIASSRKHDLFDQAGSSFYDDLDELRRIRNRVHLQNEKRDLEDDDLHAFSEARLTLSERALEYVMKTLQDKHPRATNKFTKKFELPWDPYFP